MNGRQRMGGAHNKVGGKGSLHHLTPGASKLSIFSCFVLFIRLPCAPELLPIMSCFETFLFPTEAVNFNQKTCDWSRQLQGVRALRARNAQKVSELGCRKWGCNKWGLKGCLAALPGNRPKSDFFALFLPFSPFFAGSEE